MSAKYTQIARKMHKFTLLFAMENAQIASQCASTCVAAQTIWFPSHHSKGKTQHNRRSMSQAHTVRYSLYVDMPWC